MKKRAWQDYKGVLGAYSAQKLSPQEELTPGKAPEKIIVFERETKKKKKIHIKKASMGDCGGQISRFDSDVVVGGGLKR